MTATLNAPLIISNYTPSIKFREVAIVEIGEAGTSYGDSQFWDYVIVEATKHKEDNWKNLIDGLVPLNFPQLHQKYTEL